MRSLDSPRALITLLTVDRGAERGLRYGGACSAGVVEPRIVPHGR